MPETAPPDARQPSTPQYPPPFQYQEQPPQGVVPSLLRESGGLLKTLNGVSPILLAVLALVGMCCVLLYGLIFVAPTMQQEGIGQLNRSNEDQRELDRAMYREERDKDRRAEASRERSREIRDKAMLDTLAEVKTAVVEVRGAVSKWEKK